MELTLCLIPLGVDVCMYRDWAIDIGGKRATGGDTKENP